MAHPKLSKNEKVLLDKFEKILKIQLEKYLNEEKKEVITTVEKTFEKYSAPLTDLKREREHWENKLNKFLAEIGYLS